ncbi:hypothetical protein [Bacillus sp. FSL K6-3431]|uniref:hypothetical protein n=1 Tax=Bacillus sp. FSL K6-3431 TaxID=2921500 RepID=UPI0030F9B596
MNITINVNAPELADAISALAVAMSGGIPLVPVTEVEEPKIAKIEKKKEETKTEVDPEKVKVAAAEKAKKEAEEKAARIAAEKAEKVAVEKDEPKPTTISLDIVRSKLADFSSQGKAQQVEVMEALSRFGVKKLTDVKPEDYKELLELVGLSV